MGAALEIPSIVQMTEDAVVSVVGRENAVALNNAIPSWIPRPDYLACSTGQTTRDAAAFLGYDCDNTPWSGGSGGGGDGGDDTSFPADTSNAQQERAAGGGLDPIAEPWLVDPTILDLPPPVAATAEYLARFNAAKEARDAARAQEAAAQAAAVAAAAAAAAAAAEDAALRTPLDASGPGANQGNPQPIPNVGGNSVQEIEPQRVYNEDHTNLPSYMQMPTNQNELNYDGNGGSSLPIVTIGTVAIGGVLIFLWNSRGE